MAKTKVRQYDRMIRTDHGGGLEVSNKSFYDSLRVPLTGSDVMLLMPLSPWRLSSIRA